MVKFVLAILVLLLTSACSTQPKSVAPKPVIKSIAIIPATNPVHYSIKNFNAVRLAIPLAGTANYLDSKSKANTFTAKLSTQSTSLGADFTEAIASSLRGYGYEVSILDVARQADDPDNVDHESIQTSADAILHLKFEDVGLYSSETSIAYLPRVASVGTLFIIEKGEEVELYDHEIDYGANTGLGLAGDRSIPSDEKFAYPTFEAVLANIESVRKAFDAGAQEISKRMSLEIHEVIK